MLLIFASFHLVLLTAVYSSSLGLQMFLMFCIWYKTPTSDIKYKRFWEEFMLPTFLKVLHLLW